MTTATYVKDLTGFNGDARLYHLSQPVSFGWDDESSTDYVVVSAIGSAFDTFEAETYIFPADEHGTVINWGELDGSFQGGFNHVLALTYAGWIVA
jgi:hypothetical protein